MIQKQIAGWHIEFDKGTTESAYAIRPLEMGCACHACRNFSAAVWTFPYEVCEFFKVLGVDIAKPAEVYENVFEINHVRYGGFYHIVGNYLSGNDIWQPVDEHSCQMAAAKLSKIADNFYVGFTRKAVLVPDGFPRPVLQMEIDFLLPWVLEESYDG